MQQTVTSTGTTTSPFVGQQCVTGRFNLLVFILGQPSTQIFPPPQGDVIGQIQPLTGGAPIPVIQTQQTNIPLARVDNQIVTLCGVFVVRQGRVVLDVRTVLAPQPAPQPQPPVDLQTLLLLLFLLGFFGRTPFGFGGLGGGGLGGLGAAGGLGALGGLGGTTGVGGAGI